MRANGVEAPFARLRFPSVAEIRKTIPGGGWDLEVAMRAESDASPWTAARLRTVIHELAEGALQDRIEPPLPYQLGDLIIGMSATMQAREAGIVDAEAAEAAGTFEMMANPFAQRAAELAVRAAIAQGSYQPAVTDTAA